MTDSDEQRIYRVGISGSYGGLNMGDEAILETIITSLKQSIPVEITVFSRNPEDTLQRYPVQKSVPVRDLTKSEVAPEIRNLDLFILGGGGILYDEEAKI
ncbi:MAG: polysaccharide pyruvyl transferase, partial [Desulfomonilia bacterium]